MKKSTLHNYALQWGRTLPKKVFEVPEKLYVPSKSHCYRNGGKPCFECRGCIEWNCMYVCHVCGRKQCDDLRRRFVEVAYVSETANGLLEARLPKDRATTMMCRPCADVVIHSDPSYPMCLDGNYFEDSVVSSVCKLNGKDFPPLWAEGRKVLAYNVFYDKTGRDGMVNNLWNGVLDHSEYEVDHTDEVLKDKVLVDAHRITQHLSEFYVYRDLYE